MHKWIGGQHAPHYFKQAYTSPSKSFITKIIASLISTFKPLFNAYNHTPSLKALKGLCPYKKVCLYLRSEQVNLI